MSWADILFINYSSEKTSTQWSNNLKKAIALAIALTLSGEPAEAKTYEKQEFPTEMVANIPWEISPMTENVEQSTLPNYIKQAENWVRKYYPEFVEYFKEIFKNAHNISQDNQHKYIIDNINKIIQENFEIFEEELPTEKDRVTTILLSLESIISWQNQLYDKLKWNNKNSDLIGVSNEIIIDFKKRAKNHIKKTRENINKTKEEAILIKTRTNKLNEIINYINSHEINKETMEKIVDKMEEYLMLFNINDVKEDQGLQKIIKHYINYSNQINRVPSQRWKIFIEEYKKVN